MPLSSKTSSRTVRFEDDTTQSAAVRPYHEDTTATTTNDDDDDSERNDNPAIATTTMRPRKRPRPERWNDDEVDDVDDWQPIPNDGEEGEEDMDQQHADELKQVYEKRRYGDVVQEDNPTQITATTSLATEGIAIEPFHMKQEESDGTGYFDGDTYIFRHDRRTDEEPDAWLDQMMNDDENNNNNKNSHHTNPVNRLGTTKTSTAASIQDKDDNNNNNDSSDNDLDSLDTTSLYARLIPLVSDTETILQAIARYGNLGKRSSAIKSNRSPPNNNNNNNGKALQQMNLVTELSSALLRKGILNVYEMTRSDLLQQLPSNSSTATSVPPTKLFPPKHSSSSSSSVQWEYQGQHDGQIHGPYSTVTMQQWIQAGYFVGSSVVQVRTVSAQPASLSSHTQEDLLNDLLDDHDDDNEKLQNSVVRGEWFPSDQIDFRRYS